MTIENDEEDFGDLGDLDGGDLESQDDFEDLHPAEPAEELGLPEETEEEETEEDEPGEVDEGEEELSEETEDGEPEEVEESDEEEVAPVVDTAAQLAAQQTIADLEAQLEQASQTNRTLVDDKVAADLSQVDAEIEVLQKDLMEAIEEGDAKTQAEVQVKVTAAASRKTQLEQHTPTPDTPVQTSAPQDGRLVSRYPKANEYIALNPWVGSPAHGEQTQALTIIDKALMAEGYNPNDDDYYVQLASRLNRRFPGLMKVKGTEAKPKRKKKMATKPVVPTDRGKVSRKTRKRQKTTLMAEDRDVMQKFGLDPRNAEHRTSFLKNKHERLRSEAKQA